MTQGKIGFSGSKRDLAGLVVELVRTLAENRAISVSDALRLTEHGLTIQIEEREHYRMEQPRAGQPVIGDGTDGD